MTPYRLFLAHPKNLSDEEIDALRDSVRGAVAYALPDRDVEVTTGRDDYATTFRRCGTWTAWAKNVATGVEYGTGLPRYHAIVVAPVSAVGKATGEILRAAMSAHKPVFLFQGETLSRVQRLETPAHGGDYFTDTLCVT